MKRQVNRGVKALLSRLSARWTAAFVFLISSWLDASAASQFLFDANGNLFAQTIATNTSPQIIGQPQNQVVEAGGVAAFSVIVANPQSVTYQWRFNGANLGGATSTSLVVENVNTGDQGEYRVVLTNPSGSVTSAPAMLWIDDDADGMGDSWEFAQFGSLGFTATGDTDGDGVSNLQEFLDGTDPTNPSSTRYRLLVIRDGGTVIKTVDQGSYTNGEPVTLTAIASPGGEPFHGWLGDITTRSNPVTLVMTSNMTIFARFTPIDLLWTNQASGAWEAATNWRPNLAPDENDNAIITNAVTVTLNAAADCHQVTISGAFSPTLTGSGTLTVRGGLLWTTGTMSGNGRTVVESNATLALANPFGVTLSGRLLENGGAVLQAGAGSLALQSGAVITNRPGSVFELRTGAGIVSVSPSNRIDNAGTFRKWPNTGTTTIPATVSFNNPGTVEVLGGTLSLAGGGVSSGTFAAAAAGVTEWSGGTFVWAPGTSLDGGGIYRLSGGIVTAVADVTVENLEVISAFSTLGGTGVVAIASGLHWTAGTMGGGGRTIIQPGATANLAVPNQVILATRTLENGGTVNWSGAGIISLNNSSVTNRAGALFQAQNAAQISFGGGVCRFDNAGTFRKASSSGTTTVPGGIAFNNSGAVDIQSGTLLVNGGFTNSGSVSLSEGTTNRLVNGGASVGSFTAAERALVEWTAGTFALGSGASLNGAGIYRLNGGNVSAAADVTPDNLDLLSDFSTLSGVGVVTIARRMNWTGGTISGGSRTIIAPGATLQVASSGQVNLVTRTLENGGTVNWTGAGTIVLNSSSITNRAGALFHAQNAAPISSGGGVCRFDNAGTFRKSASAGTTTVFSGINFNNSGALDLQSGAFVVNGGFTNRGTVSLLSGATNRLAGGGVSEGAFTAATTAVVEWTGATFALGPGASLNGAGLYQLNGGSVTAAVDLTVQNLDLVSAFSTLGGSGVVAITGGMNWTAGTMSGGGQTIIHPGATATVAPPNVVSLSGRTLDNAGTMVWSGAGNISVTSGTITNRAGALFHAQNAAPISFGGGVCRFDNAGTFRKSANPGNSTVASGVNFTNYGTVDIRIGKLLANGGYASASNALLNCALGGNTPGTGCGQLQVAGAVTLNGFLSVDFTNGFSPALNDTFTVLTAGTRNGAFASFLYPSNNLTMQLSNTPTAVVLRATDLFSAVPRPVLLPPELTGTDLKLTWSSVSNSSYRVEFSVDLTNLTNWTAVPGDITAASNTASKLDPLTPSNRLYRVRVLP